MERPRKKEKRRRAGLAECVRARSSPQRPLLYDSPFAYAGIFSSPLRSHARCFLSASMNLAA